MQLKRVFITGMGAVTPIGIGIKEFYNNLVAGVNGIKLIKSFNTDNYSSHVAGEVNREFFNTTGSTNRNLAVLYAQQAISEALLMSNKNNDDLKKCALVLSTAVGGIDMIYPHFTNKHFSGTAKPEDYALAGEYPFHSIAKNISTKFNIQGYCVTNISACTAGNAAIGYAFDLIRTGMVNMAIVGGVDVLSEFEFACFSSFRSLDTDSCRPFDKMRKGLILSEGAAFLVLEAADVINDEKRILAEIGSYALTNDALDMTAPDEEGRMAAKAITTALVKANLSVDDVDYICAHGTGTPLNDKSETAAIKLALKEKAYKTPISSIKSALGHLNSTSGTINAISCILNILNSKLPPTINLEHADEFCDLDYIPNVMRNKEVAVCLSNAFAFGGQCSSLVIKKFLKN